MVLSYSFCECRNNLFGNDITVFRPAVGLTEPTAGLVFYPKNAVVHRLYIVLKKLCSTLVREV